MSPHLPPDSCWGKETFVRLGVFVLHSKRSATGRDRPRKRSGKGLDTVIGIWRRIANARPGSALSLHLPALVLPFSRCRPPRFAFLILLLAGLTLHGSAHAQTEDAETESGTDSTAAVLPEPVRPTMSGDCQNNAVIILRPDRSFTNDCPGVRYVVQKTYFDNIYRGYASGRRTVPLVEEALADRDSLITVLREKDALLDSTRQALVQMSAAMSQESVQALTAASDTLSVAVLPELRAVREDIRETQSTLRKAERNLFWSQLKFAAVPALAGVAVGFLLGR